MVTAFLERRRGGGDEAATAARLRLERLLGRIPAPALATAPSALSEQPEPEQPDQDAMETGAPAPRGLVVDPTRRGALALAGLATVSVLVTGGLVWRSRPRPVAVVPPVVSTSSAPAATAVVVVDVQGAVRRPGLVTLPAGARVADALAGAGGLKPGATTAGLNLARRVSDGEQVLVAVPGAAPPVVPGAGASAGTSAGSRLDLNLATLEQLDALPGVGPVTAQRILDWRDQHGRFASVDQLREVDGIGDKRFEALRDLVTV